LPTPIAGKIAAIAALVAACAFVAAQDWPTRPLTMLVPYAPGGAFDVIGRIFGARMSETLRQPVITENVGGAGGTIGANRVAKADPDGYLFLLGSVGTQAYSQTLYRHPPYNTLTDFTPVALFAEQPMVLATRSDFPAGNLPEFVAYVKANMLATKFGTAGIGSTTYLACTLLNATLGITATQVPYRGGGPLMTDMMAGHVDYGCDNIVALMPHIRGRTLKPIATLARHRSPLLPDLATVQEQGFGDFDVTTWNAFFLPKGAPAAIVDKLNRATVEAMNDPTVQDRMRQIGVSLVATERRSPEYLASFVRDEIDKWAVAIRASGVQLD
jgi:tripartite-type tricarboxylate transporter receptor subunit TctC